MTHKIFNATNILGATAFFAMLAAIGAAEGENFVLAVILIAVLAVCAYLSNIENGKRK